MTSNTFHPKYRVGYWISQKKHRSLRFDQFHEYCRQQDMLLVEIDLDADLAGQGPFDCIFHKLSDVYAKVEAGDEKAAEQWNRFQKFADDHPNVPIVDPLDSIVLLCDRAVQYELLQSVCDNTDKIRTPAFAKLTSTSKRTNCAKLNLMGVTYPLVCKPLVAHGSPAAHMISLVFNSKGVAHMTPSCVAQSFHAHNGVLFKLFVIGDRHFILRRPSLKNFVASREAENVHFDSHKISKEGCVNELCQSGDVLQLATEPAVADLTKFVARMQARSGLTLFGVDLIQDAATGVYYAIDVNVFPSYDGVPNMFDHLHRLLVASCTRGQSRRHRCKSNLMEYDAAVFDSGLGTSESDQSDSNAKRSTALRRSLSHNVHAHHTSHSVGRLDDQRRPGIWPDWQRIKQFYGIPKPAGRFLVENVEAADSRGVKFDLGDKERSTVEKHRDTDSSQRMAKINVSDATTATAMAQSSL